MAFWAIGTGTPTRERPPREVVPEPHAPRRRRRWPWVMGTLVLGLAVWLGACGGNETVRNVIGVGDGGEVAAPAPGAPSLTVPPVITEPPATSPPATEPPGTVPVTTTTTTTEPPTTVTTTIPPTTTTTTLPGFYWGMDGPPPLGLLLENDDIPNLGIQAAMLSGIVVEARDEAILMDLGKHPETGVQIVGEFGTYGLNICTYTGTRWVIGDPNSPGATGGQIRCGLAEPGEIAETLEVGRQYPFVIWLSLDCSAQGWNDQREACEDFADKEKTSFVDNQRLVEFLKGGEVSVTVGSMKQIHVMPSGSIIPLSSDW